MNVLKIAAFSDGDIGGNPAGVALSDTLPAPEKMQESAAEVGFSETAFAALEKDQKTWRVRYFSPESEVPFCGHATIALGAALAEKFGPGKYMLRLNDAEISVEGEKLEDRYAAALQSPPTRSDPLGQSEVEATLALFGYSHDQLDDSIPPARIHGGADHYVFALKNRDDLRSMKYDLDSGRQFMRSRDLITIMLLWREDETTFHVRNAFASGGVLEDPATGAAAAAFSGYLKDIAWPHGGKINIIQGEDMGARSLITAEIGDEAGSSIRVSGMTRKMDD
ncbi:PhzF family phenazine biosynthesis protein [uncultured Sneathiella sp.]|uniref:PhzF family phenazine biosynthesis protein n=1 Tax=uncultured Sneathiella sp. TaxID=879315 RepID=UPI00259672E1|nr:PhzF family phenazine biosynthesis protein [uncultured Sneathiella sp.]